MPVFPIITEPNMESKLYAEKFDGSVIFAFMEEQKEKGKVIKRKTCIAGLDKNQVEELKRIL